MPVHIEEFTGINAVVFRCRGTVTGAELGAAKGRLLAEPEKLAGYLFGMVDHTSAQDVEYEPLEIRWLAEQDRAIAKIVRPHWPVAVVSPEDLQFGFSRMWQALVETTGWQTAVFRSQAPAHAWLRMLLVKTHDAAIPEFDLNSASRRLGEPTEV